ncbi:MAG: O-antigen ligase family protein [Solirubrobacterales bacterium]
MDPAKGLWLGGLGLCAAFVGFLAGVEPKLALGAAIAAAFLLLVFVDLAAGLAVFGFFSFLELLELGSALSVSKLGGVLLAISWLAFVLTREDGKSDFLSVHPVMSIVLGIFLGWVALSSLWAESTAAVTSSLWRYLLNAILFLIVFSAIRTHRQAVMVVTGFLAGSAAAGLYGMFFIASAVPIAETGRLGSSTLDPNELAAVLVAGMALSVGLLMNVRDPGAKLIVASAGGFCFLATMLTGSRGGLVALTCMLIAAIVFGGRWRPQLAVAGAVMAMFTAFYITSLAPAEVRERVTATAGETRTTEGRTTLWQIGGRMVRAHPLNGVGAGNFQVSSRHYLIQPGTVFRSDEILLGNKETHNTYLQTAAELGLIGLGLFLTIILFSLGCLVRAAGIFRKGDKVSHEALARSMIVATIGLLAADFFISEMFSKQLWLMLGVGPALLGIARREQNSNGNQARHLAQPDAA